MTLGTAIDLHWASNPQLESIETSEDRQPPNARVCESHPGRLWQFCTVCVCVCVCVSTGRAWILSRELLEGAAILLSYTEAPKKKNKTSSLILVAAHGAETVGPAPEESLPPFYPEFFGPRLEDLCGTWIEDTPNRIGETDGLSHRFIRAAFIRTLDCKPQTCLGKKGRE